jgi:hypothetical protein
MLIAKGSGEQERKVPGWSVDQDHLCAALEYTRRLGASGILPGWGPGAGSI